MAEELADLVVPELGESITEAVIGRWLKNVGEAVAADEPVVDLETDKITVQLPAPVSGALTEQRYSEGDTVKVGDIVGQIDSAGAAKSSSSGAEKERSGGDGAARPAEAPQRAEAGTGNGAGEAAREVRARQPRGEAPPQPGEEPLDQQGAVDAEVLRRLTPAQRRQARMNGEVPEARREEPRASREEPRPAPREQARPARREQPRPAPAGAPRDDEEVVRMSPLRKRIAERLVQAQTESASLTTFNEVDMSAVMALRARYKDEFLARHGVKLGFMSFFAKACVHACQLFPGLNAEIRDDSIVYKKHYDFGIAVSTERGLVVPVLRDVAQKSFAAIEAGIVELGTRARDNKLGLEDLTGGTFTITNGGIFGSMLSTPLLNYPQTGILGMHNIVDRPVVVDGAVEVRPVMYIALTYDHRVVDGKQAVQFLVAVKERIEAPERLLFEV